MLAHRAPIGAVLSIVILGVVACSSGSSNNEGQESGLPDGNLIDTDRDGVPDATDRDDDNDGFLDADDPAPLDTTVPGDFSTPESILADPAIEQARREAADQGFAVEALLGTSPPDIGGYYLEVENATNFVASDTGEGVGGTRSGAEFRYDQSAANTIDGAVVNFDQARPTSYSLSFDALLRGSADRFTRYSRSRVTCTIDGADNSVLFIGISTASVEPQTGDFVERDRISVSVALFGERTDACDRYFGGAARIGSWSVSQSPRIFRSEPAEFQYMCVDDDAAYAPTERWASRDGATCSCSVDYETVCE